MSAKKDINTKQIRFCDVVQSDKQWTELCDYLDTSNSWKKMADHLGPKFCNGSYIDKLEQSHLSNLRNSPSRALLKEWQPTIEATAANFTKILKDINNVDALELFTKWIPKQI